MDSDLERYGKILMKIVIILAVIVTAYFTCRFFFPLVLDITGLVIIGLLPFILAVIIAILIDPLVDWLSEKKGMKRGVAVIITLTLLFAVISLLIVFVISRLVIELSGLYSNLPHYTQHIMNYVLTAIDQVRTYITNNPLPQEAQEALRSNLQIAIRGLSDLIAASTNLFFDLLTGLPGFITIIIVSGLATFFISRDKAVIFRFVYHLTPHKLVKPTSLVIGEITSAVLGFFRAQTILISITGILAVVGLSILDIEYALTLGILIGLLDLLPILGPGTILVPWAVVILFLGNYSFGAALLVLYGVLVGVRQLLEPKIISQNIGLHPLATLLALYLGLRFIGVWGIIIGPFLVILIKAILKSSYAK